MNVAIKDIEYKRPGQDLVERIISVMRAEIPVHENIRDLHAESAQLLGEIQLLENEAKTKRTLREVNAIRAKIRPLRRKVRANDQEIKRKMDGLGCG